MAAHMGEKQQAFRSRLSPMGHMLLPVHTLRRVFTWPQLGGDAQASPAGELSSPMSVATYAQDRVWSDDEVQSALSLEDARSDAESTREEGITNGGHEPPVRADTILESSASSTQGCEHNSWDKVRVKRDRTTLRCRVCQFQCKVFNVEGLRCPHFDADGRCPLGKECSRMHIHHSKLTLRKRREVWGEGPGVGCGARAPPVHQSLADLSQQCDAAQPPRSSLMDLSRPAPLCCSLQVDVPPPLLSPFPTPSDSGRADDKHTTIDSGCHFTPSQVYASPSIYWQPSDSRRASSTSVGIPVVHSYSQQSCAAYRSVQQLAGMHTAHRRLSSASTGSHSSVATQGTPIVCFPQAYQPALPESPPHPSPRCSGPGMDSLASSSMLPGMPSPFNSPSDSGCGMPSMPSGPRWGSDVRNVRSCRWESAAATSGSTGKRGEEAVNCPTGTHYGCLPSHFGYPPCPTPTAGFI